MQRDGAEGWTRRDERGGVDEEDFHSGTLDSGITAHHDRGGPERSARKEVIVMDTSASILQGREMGT